MGPNQRRPANFLKALRNDSFKTSLIDYLLNSWEQNAYSVLVRNKVVFVTHEEKCYKFEARDNKMIKSEDI